MRANSFEVIMALHVKFSFMIGIISLALGLAAGFVMHRSDFCIRTVTYEVDI